MQPPPYLDIAISMNQHSLFDHTKHEIFMGKVMEVNSGEKAVNKVIKRRINMYTGNVAKY